MNLVIADKDTKQILHFVRNATRSGMDVVGDNVKLMGLKVSAMDFVWTTDELVPKYVSGKKKVTWDKRFNEIIQVTDRKESALDIVKDAKGGLGARHVKASFDEIVKRIDKVSGDLAKESGNLKAVTQTLQQEIQSISTTVHAFRNNMLSMLNNLDKRIGALEKDKQP